MNTDTEKMTFEEFIVDVCSDLTHSKDQRLGQAYMNRLHFYRPDLYDEVMEPGLVPIDPFYNDDNIPKFLAFIAERW